MTVHYEIEMCLCNDNWEPPSVFMDRPNIFSSFKRADKYADFFLQRMSFRIIKVTTTREVIE